LIVEPDAEVAQNYPSRQTHPQTPKLMGPLPPESEGVEHFVVEKLSTIWRMLTIHHLKGSDQLRLRELRLGGWLMCAP
jgi:hypothetical protein